MNGEMAAQSAHLTEMELMMKRELEAMERLQLTDPYRELDRKSLLLLPGIRILSRYDGPLG